MARFTDRSAVSQIDLIAALTAALFYRKMDSDEEKEALRDLSDNEAFKSFCEKVEENRERADWEK